MNPELGRNLIRITASRNWYIAATFDGSSGPIESAESAAKVLVAAAIRLQEDGHEFDATARDVTDPWPVVAGCSVFVFYQRATAYEAETWVARLIDSRGLYEAAYGLSGWRALANLGLTLIDRGIVPTVSLEKGIDA